MPLLLPRVRQIKLKRRIRMHYAVEQGRKYNPLRFDHPTRFVRALVTINIDGRTTAKRRILGRSGNWPRQSEAWNAGRIWPRTSHQFLLFFYVCSVIFLSSPPFPFNGDQKSRSRKCKDECWRGVDMAKILALSLEVEIITILRFFDLKDGKILYISFV